MPVATNGIAQNILELWSVECAFAGIDRGLDAVAGLRLDLLQHLRHHGFGVIPRRIRADAFLGPGRQLDDQLSVEAEVVIGRQDQVVDLEALVGELFFGAEDMCVVLREAAHAQQAVHRARRFIAMHHAELRKADRQVAIAGEAVLVDLHVTRAVHRFDREPALVFGFVAGGLCREHALAIPLPVAGRFPQRLVEHLRRVDFVVITGQAPPHIGDDGLEQRPALGVPKDNAGAFFLEMKQVELTAEAAVIALLGFFHLLEVSVELFLLGKRSAVDAGEHRIVGVAAPIGAGYLHQLEGVANFTDARHVRAAAQVEPVALLVDLQRLVFRDCVNQLDLEVLALVAEHLLGFLARPFFLGEGFVARDDLAHFLFDDWQVFRHEGFVAREVIIEAVLDHRTDGDLRAGPQILHRFGENVCGVMPDQFQRARVVAVDEFDFGVGVDRIGEVDDLAVERHRDGAFGQRGRDALGDIKAGDVVRIVPTRAIGKGQRDHVFFSCSSLPRTSVGKRIGVAEAYIQPVPSTQLGWRHLVRAPPSPVAPGLPPMRGFGQGGGHEIEPVRAPGLAADDSRERHPGARPQSKTADRFVGIFRAARQVTAARPDQRRQREAVELHQRASGEPRQAGKTVQSRG